MSMASRVGGRSLWKWFSTSSVFGKYIIVTNTLTWSVLMGGGDSMAQFLERRQAPHKNGKHDWVRTRRMMVMGLATGPLNHGWYAFLDRLVPATTIKSVAKKIALDEMFASPFFGFTFFMGMGYLEGQTNEDSWDEFKCKFWTVYKADLSIWPAAQAINFYFLPSQVRVLYVGAVTFGWNTFLSYMKHKHVDGQKKTVDIPCRRSPNDNVKTEIKAEIR